MFFNAVLGTPPAWLWRAMAAGIPIVTTSYTPIPETESVCRFVPVKQIGRYYTQIPIDKVIVEIEDLLNHPQSRMGLSVAGYKASQAYTWNKTAEQFLFIHDKLYQIHGKLQSPQPQTDVHFKSLFVQQYDKGKSKTYSQTLRLPSKTPEPLEKGLIRELLRWYNDKEVQSVLDELGKTENSTKSALHNTSD